MFSLLALKIGSEILRTKLSLQIVVADHFFAERWTYDLTFKEFDFRAGSCVASCFCKMPLAMFSWCCWTGIIFLKLRESQETNLSCFCRRHLLGPQTWESNWLKQHSEQLLCWLKGLQYVASRNFSRTEFFQTSKRYCHHVGSLLETMDRGILNHFLRNIHSYQKKLLKF